VYAYTRAITLACTLCCNSGQMSMFIFRSIWIPLCWKLLQFHQVGHGFPLAIKTLQEQSNTERDIMDIPHNRAQSKFLSLSMGAVAGFVVLIL
jgi:hypothetical protein